MVGLNWVLQFPVNLACKFSFSIGMQDGEVDTLVGVTDSLEYAKAFEQTNPQTFFNVLSSYREAINNTSVHDWVFIVLISCCVCVAWLLWNRNRMVKLHVFSLFSKNAQLQILNDDTNQFLNPPSILMLVFIAIAGLFGLVLNNEFKLNLFSEQSGVVRWLFITGIVGSFYLIKNIIITISGYLFSIQGVALQYIKLVNMYNRGVGLVLLPLVVLIMYTDPIATEFLVFISLGFLIFIHVSRIGRKVFQGFALSGVSKFHIFLYLCGLEILPFVVAIKALIIQKG